MTSHIAKSQNSRKHYKTQAKIRKYLQNVWSLIAGLCTNSKLLTGPSQALTPRLARREHSSIFPNFAKDSHIFFLQNLLHFFILVFRVGDPDRPPGKALATPLFIEDVSCLSLKYDPVNNCKLAVIVPFIMFILCSLVISGVHGVCGILIDRSH